MKLARLTDARFHAALSKLSAQPMPLRVAFKLKGIQAKVHEENRKLEECRQSALQKYGDKTEDGKLSLKDDNTVNFTKENIEAFVKEMNELGQTELELGTVTLAELGDKAELTVDDVVALDGLLIE